MEGSIRYKVQLVLNAGEHYSGVMEVEFNLQHVNSDIFIDYNGDAIEKLVVNDAVISKAGGSHLN